MIDSSSQTDTVTLAVYACNHKQSTAPLIFRMPLFKVKLAGCDMKTFVNEDSIEAIIRKGMFLFHVCFDFLHKKGSTLIGSLFYLYYRLSEARC